MTQTAAHSSTEPAVGVAGDALGGTDRRWRVCLVGPGFHFLGGLSVYTCRLANALAESHDVSVVLLNKLIPRALYPGGDRSGQDLTSLEYRPDVKVVANVDWYWGRQVTVAIRHLRRTRPDVLVLQWWTAATMHTYLVLAAAAHRLGIPVVLEFHETQDPGEAAMPLVARYLRATMPSLLTRASGGVVHNEHDRELLAEAFGAAAMGRLRLAVAPHGPYDHLPSSPPPEPPVPTEPDGTTRLLFFGLIRPYKGVEDLVAAFDALSPVQADKYTLTIVGETWENWTVPQQAIEVSRYRHRITFVNRYVTDAEAGQYFAAADAVVLPYRRGSASGPLQIAMSAGLPVVLYAVGGLVEAVEHYEGARLVTPGDVVALSAALAELPARRGQRYADPHSWSATVAAYAGLAAELAPR